MMRLGWCAMVSLVLMTGCGPKPEPRPPQLPPEEEAELHTTFEHAREAMARHDAAGWTDEACRATAAQFAEVADRLAQGDPRASHAARYDQGLALSRCRLHDEAQPVFEALVADAPDHHRAKVQLALHRLDSEGRGFLSAAIEMVGDAVVASRFRDAAALVSLASLQMDRGNAEPDDDGIDDFERARRNLRRALAVDDGFMPAYNQLAILHLELARRDAGSKSRALIAAAEETARADTRALELAALICSQAMRKRADYAPIHNTAGLIAAELGDLSGAARAFGRARQLDPRLFEAHMNDAAVNLQFRGFEPAEGAYRAALGLRPDSYEAHLGLALALRGRIGPDSETERLDEARKMLRRAKQLAPDRPEAYFNEAILVQEFLARGAGPEVRPRLVEAKRLFGSFAERARTRPAMKAALARATERMRDIDELLSFLQRTP